MTDSNDLMKTAVSYAIESTRRICEEEYNAATVKMVEQMTAITRAHIAELEADNARLREALEEFVASTGVSDDPDVLLVDALVYENAMRVLGLQK